MTGARSTVSTRRVAALGLVLAVALAASVVLLNALGWPAAADTPGVVADNGGDGGNHPATGPDPASEDDEGREGGEGDAAPGAGADDAGAGETEPDPDPAAPEPEPEPEPPAPTTAEEEVDGQQVAADFAAAFASYRYDDGPEALRERVAPFVTAELAASLEAGSGLAARSDLTARQEVAVARVDAVQPQLLGDGRMDLLVVVRQDISTVEGATTRYQSYLTRVERTDVGWRVTGFQP